MNIINHLDHHNSWTRILKPVACYLVVIPVSYSMEVKTWKDAVECSSGNMHMTVHVQQMGACTPTATSAQLSLRIHQVQPRLFDNGLPQDKVPTAHPVPADQR